MSNNFTKDNVKTVLESLKVNPTHFVSEAHLQTAFIITAALLFQDKYDFYPEFPLTNPKDPNKRDEIDLYIKSKKDDSVTLIEFKYKTKNVSNNSKKSPSSFPVAKTTDITPANQGAQMLGRFDCWSDIERIEDYCSKNSNWNGFFIFITNDDLYKEETGTDTFGREFSMTSGNHVNKTKDWLNGAPYQDIINSISKKRARQIILSSDYYFEYQEFSKDLNKSYGTFWSLVVPIQKP